MLKKQINLRVPAKDKRLLERHAAKTRRTMTDLVLSRLLPLLRKLAKEEEAA